MKPDHIDNLIQYTTLAATTAAEIASAFHVPFLGSTATLTLSILKCVESLKASKDEVIQMVEQIHEILCAILKLYTTSEIKGTLPTALLYDIAKFTETLQKIFTVLQSNQRMGKIKQLFRQPYTISSLKICKEELDSAQAAFKVRVTGLTGSQISQMKKAAKQLHEELVGLLNAYPDLTSSDRSSVTGTLRSSRSSAVSLAMLPPAPQILHGRDAELLHTVKILVQDSARIAVLGAGGMGKTSLATAALHNVEVEAKYDFRYFVACHSAPTCLALLAIIAEHLGLEKGPGLSRRIVNHFISAPTSLLVLDNLETVWESASSRSEVEEFLSLLADVAHLGLMIAMRGAERPAKVKWTRPFLGPLKPLCNSAALQTFIDVADDIHEEDSVNRLLGLTGNLPLAVSLMASVVAHEGCDNALKRWTSESTRMISEGYDQRSSLDISIMLSFTSPRMTPEAQKLLSILSMLPDGLPDAELVQANLPILDILKCKSILIKTSLAFVEEDQRLKVLAPIREHTLHIHPPPNALKSKILRHFHELLHLWNQFNHLNPADIVPKLSQNLGNMNSILRDALSTECSDTIFNIQSILFLNHFYRMMEQTVSPLLPDLLPQMQQWQDKPIFGKYLIERFRSSDHLPVNDAENQIRLGNRYFNKMDALEQAQWYYALGVHFRSQNLDMTLALEAYGQALSLSDSTGCPTTVGLQALCMMTQIKIITGNILGAQECANRGQKYSEDLGDLHTEAYCLLLQASCEMTFANYRRARALFQHAKSLVDSCGLQGGTMDMNIRNGAAEIHLLQTQYADSRNEQVSILSSLRPTTYPAIMTNLNIALIDTNTGADAWRITETLDACRLHLQALHGGQKQHLQIVMDRRYADLALREGYHGTASAMFQRLALSCQYTHTDTALSCLERLADLSNGMSNVGMALKWAGIFLALALRSRARLAMVQALRCLGQIVAAKGDNHTALNLFTVAVEGFTYMDVHRWRADCMVRIADILESQGETTKAIGLWKAARPLFKRSSQTKDVTRIDVKLAAVDSVISEKGQEVA